MNATKLKRLSTGFRQDTVETFAEYQKRQRPRKNPYLSEPHARPTLVDIGGAQKSFLSTKCMAQKMLHLKTHWKS